MRWTGLKIKIEPSFVVLLCCLLWLEHDGAAAVFLLSAALHEAGHLLALFLLDVPACGLELRASGAVLHTGLTTPGKEAICTAAGPMINLLLLCLFFRRRPTAALINLLLFAYNLLPVYPLDGGRLLRLLLCRLLGIRAGERVSDALTVTLTVAAVAFGILLTCVFHAGLYPCLLAALFLCRQTIPACKFRRVRLK